MRLSIALFLILFLWICPLTGFAYDSQQPIELESDNLEVNNESGTLVYRGNVKLKQGFFKLTADQLTIHTTDRDVTRIDAVGGPVHLEDMQSDGKIVIAEALKMIYDVIAKTITLEGSGLLNHDGNIMRSQSIFYNLENSDLRAGETGRVKMTLQPKKSPSQE